jgi:hypothetical protein
MESVFIVGDRGVESIYRTPLELMGPR